jgi:hypothetical protein
VQQGTVVLQCRGSGRASPPAAVADVDAVDMAMIRNHPIQQPGIG